MNIYKSLTLFLLLLAPSLSWGSLAGVQNIQLANMSSYTLCLNALKTVIADHKLKVEFLVTPQSLIYQNKQGEVVSYSKEGAVRVSGRNCESPQSLDKKSIEDGIIEIIDRVGKGKRGHSSDLHQALSKPCGDIGSSRISEKLTQVTGVSLKPSKPYGSGFFFGEKPKEGHGVIE